MRTKTLYRRDGERIGISRFPNFHKSGSIAGMKRLYYGKNALLVRCYEHLIVMYFTILNMLL